jgi:hypothetical protein
MRGDLMSYYDRTQEERAVAEEIAIRAGYLNRCEGCSEIYDPGSEDPEPAYRLAISLIKEKDALVKIFWNDPQRLTDLIKELVEQYPELCHCRSVFEEIKNED